MTERRPDSHPSSYGDGKWYGLKPAPSKLSDSEFAAERKRHIEESNERSLDASMSALAGIFGQTENLDAVRTANPHERAVDDAILQSVNKKVIVRDPEAERLAGLNARRDPVTNEIVRIETPQQSEQSETETGDSGIDFNPRMVPQSEIDSYDEEDAELDAELDTYLGEQFGSYDDESDQ